MIESPTANFSGSDQGLFSPAAIRDLMRAELERSRRYGHPLACFVVSVDRLGYLTDYYGYESREEVLEGVVELLLAKLRVGDFLGCREGDAFLLVLPFTPPEGARALASRLLSGSRELEFDCDGRRLVVTLSIGAAYAGQPGVATFEDLRRTAERGAESAASAGGGRLVEWRAPEPEGDAGVTALRVELEERMRVLKESLQVARPEPAAVPAELTLADKLRELLEGAVGEEDGGDEREAALQARIQGLMAQHNRQIDVLERRIGKLTCSLEATEEELRRMALLRDVDSGIASIYREVQGLDADDRESRGEMMSAIFQANIALHDEIARRAQGA